MKDKSSSVCPVNDTGKEATLKTSEWYDRKAHPRHLIASTEVQWGKKSMVSAVIQIGLMSTYYDAS